MARHSPSFSFGGGRERTLMKGPPITIDNLRSHLRGNQNCCQPEPQSCCGCLPMSPCCPPKQSACYPPGCCFPCFPPPVCCPSSQFCSPGPPRISYNTPRAGFHCQPLPKIGNNSGFRGSSSFPFGSTGDTPSTFNNCNFYISEPPFNKNIMMGDTQLTSESGEILPSDQPDEEVRITPGDDRVFEPPLGYNGSRRSSWGMDESSKPPAGYSGGNRNNWGNDQISKQRGGYSGNKGDHWNNEQTSKAPGGYSGTRGNPWNNEQTSMAPGGYTGNRGNPWDNRQTSKAPGGYSGTRGNPWGNRQTSKAPGGYSGNRGNPWGNEQASKAPGGYSGNRGNRWGNEQTSKGPGGYSGNRGNPLGNEQGSKAPGGYSGNRGNPWGNEQNSKGPGGYSGSRGNPWGNKQTSRTPGAYSGNEENRRGNDRGSKSPTGYSGSKGNDWNNGNNSKPPVGYSGNEENQWDKDQFANSPDGYSGSKGNRWKNDKFSKPPNGYSGNDGNSWDNEQMSNPPVGYSENNDNPSNGWGNDDKPCGPGLGPCPTRSNSEIKSGNRDPSSSRSKNESMKMDCEPSAKEKLAKTHSKHKKKECKVVCESNNPSKSCSIFGLCSSLMSKNKGRKGSQEYKLVEPPKKLRSTSSTRSHNPKSISKTSKKHPESSKHDPCVPVDESRNKKNVPNILGTDNALKGKPANKTIGHIPVDDPSLGLPKVSNNSIKVKYANKTTDHKPVDDASHTKVADSSFKANPANKTTKDKSAEGPSLPKTRPPFPIPKPDPQIPRLAVPKNPMKVKSSSSSSGSSSSSSSSSEDLKKPNPRIPGNLQKSVSANKVDLYKEKPSLSLKASKSYPEKSIPKTKSNNNIKQNQQPDGKTTLPQKNTSINPHKTESHETKTLYKNFNRNAVID